MPIFFKAGTDFLAKVAASLTRYLFCEVTNCRHSHCVAVAFSYVLTDASTRLFMRLSRRQGEFVVTHGQWNDTLFLVMSGWVQVPAPVPASVCARRPVPCLPPM